MSKMDMELEDVNWTKIKTLLRKLFSDVTCGYMHASSVVLIMCYTLATDARARLLQGSLFYSSNICGCLGYACVVNRQKIKLVKSFLFSAQSTWVYKSTKITIISETHATVLFYSKLWTLVSFQNPNISKPIAMRSLFS